ncbi:MAG: hypothetical protein JNL10_03370 [Verrucomicrobiales bacterium]|nr:hypothetical protein [Verrucomicrobiales bacterium]
MLRSRSPQICVGWRRNNNRWSMSILFITGFAVLFTILAVVVGTAAATEL